MNTRRRRGRKPRPVEDRFWEKVAEAVGPSPNGWAGCWEWQAFTHPQHGYGAFKASERRMVGAHRWAYEWVVGKIPDGLHLDHLCRNPRCVNPAHLEAVTQRENTLRGINPAAKNATKTHCKRGHPFDEANTYVDKGGGRRCRACARRRDRARSAARWEQQKQMKAA